MTSGTSEVTAFKELMDSDHLKYDTENVNM